MDIWSKVDQFLSHAGTIIAVVSLVAGVVNHKIRAIKSAGGQVPELFLQLAALLNVAAVNLDKTADLAVENPYWNPRPVTREGVRAMLQQAWEGVAP